MCNTKKKKEKKKRKKKKKRCLHNLAKVVGNLLVCQAYIRLIVSFKNMQKDVVNLLLCQDCI